MVIKPQKDSGNFCLLNVLKRKIVWIILIFFCLNISHAQNMFYHLLPGFVQAFTWVGLGGDSNWNTPSNWSTGVVPSTSDSATFDDHCISNCDPTINVGISIGGINIKNTYSGVITQASGNSITIGASGWSQTAGTFSGSDAAITMNGPFVLTGGSFTSTSTTITFAHHFTKTGGVYNANLGSTIFNANQTIIPGNVTFHHTSFTSMTTQNLSGGTMQVNGQLTLDSPSTCCGASLDNGTIEAKGDVVVANFGKPGNALISISGSTSQSLTGVATARLPSLRWASTGGTVTATGQINIYGNYSWISGVVDLSASTLVFVSSSMVNIIPGALQYNNVTFSTPDVVGAGQDLNTGTMTVNGTLTIDGNATCCEGGLNNGTIQAKGAVQFLNKGMSGSVLISVSGSSSQTITGVSTAKIPSLTINSTGGTVTLSGHLYIVGNYALTSGTVTTTGSTLEFKIISGSQSINAGSATYNNIIFQVGGIATQDLSGSTLNVSGTLTIDSTAGCCEGGLNNGNINASGSVLFTNRGRNGTAVLSYTGTTSTTLTIGTSAQTLNTTHNVAKTGAGKLSLVANTSFSSAGRNFLITSGTLDVAGFSFSVNSLLTVSAGGRLLCNGGTATAGSWTINGEVSCGTGEGITWTGAAGDNLWSSAGNWTNNTIPGASDLARFNNSVCVGANCNAQINSNLSVRGIVLDSTYSGTLTQNTTRTLTIGTGGFSQAGGIFAGGDSNITMSGAFSLSGGTFTATSAMWTHNGHFSVTGAPTFNHNNGSWQQNGSNITAQIFPNGITLNNVSFVGYSNYVYLNSGTLIVNGSLSLGDAYGGHTLSNGTIEARGDIAVANYGKIGNAVILINGTGAQALNVTAGYLPSITINKASGTLTTTGTVATGANWTYLAGTVNFGTSTVLFANGTGGTVQQIIPGSLNYQNVTFGGYSCTQNLNGGTMIINGTTTFADTYAATNFVSNGIISARGDIVVSNAGKNGTATLLIEGTGSQLLNSTAGQLPNVQINKSSGTLTLSGTIATFYNWTHSAGTVDAGTSTLVFNNGSGGGSQSITPGSMIYNNVTFAGYTAYQNLNGGSMIVTGTLSFSDTYAATNEVNNGTILARGPIVTSNVGKNGSALLVIDGTTAQTFTGTSGQTPSVEINKSSGTLSLVGTIATFGSWTHTAGTVNAGTSTIVFNNGSGSSTQQIFPGTMTYNNVNFLGYAKNQSLNSGTMNISGTVTFADGFNGGNGVNSGTINASGNVVFNSNGKAGNATLNYVGSTTTTLTRSGGWALATAHVVAKTGGGSLQLALDTTFNTTNSSQNFTVNSGTLDLNSYDLTIQGTLTVASGAVLKCSGGEFTAGTLSNSGTVNCPGYSDYDFNWTGAGGNSNWNTAGNWQGGVVPGAGDVVAFQDSTCGGTCQASINVSSSVRGVRMYGTYTGTITQSSGATLTVGAKSWTQLGGTFSGGDSNITVNLPAISGKFSVTGGTFTSTSAQLRIARSNHQQGGLNQIAFEVGASAAFNHNNGTLFMNCTETWSGSSKYGIDVPTSLTLYNLRFKADGNSGNGHYIAAGDTVTVLNDFTIESGLAVAGGFIDLHGTLNDGSSGSGVGARVVVRFKGTGAQTYGYTGTSRGVKIHVDKPSGSLTATTANVNISTLTVVNGSITAPTGILSVGVSGFNENGSMTLMTLANPAQFIHNGGTLQFYGFDDWNAAYVYTYNFGGSLTVNNAQFIGYGNSTNVIGGGSSLIVTGTTTHTSGILQGSIIAQGNVAFNSSVRGSATFQFTGGASQTVSGSYPTTGHWTVNKTPGMSVGLANSFNLNGAGQNLTVTSGILKLNSNNLTVNNNISNSGSIERGPLPVCGTISQGGSFTGNPPVCTP